MQRLALFLAALWWGGISALSFLAVPTLFASLGGPSVGGPVAAQLFSYQSYAGLLIGLALLIILRRDRSRAQFRLPDDSVDAAGADLMQMQQSLATMGFVLLGMLLAMVQEFGVAHQIITARATGGDLRLWHGLGTLLVLGQWLCAGSVLWRLSR
ncbi:MAG TPA: DUF4149 domain-containing protein [Hydrogenophaga sp.]|uniref:DUF4149 domain-containing protein n=1 Tax=Hydrogenophaga sp. TaxID=1904254 RepID=UPI002CADFC32|nr:DUF4149 domain-containing protein [Hydrogenophaga sp.]HMN91890.1 DUF4149 domain-containing protein [Hydrogenophaga sp.]HMP08970.1 DUF4149 domain-containing protein [Hydrogenophaga sp.]